MEKNEKGSPLGKEVLIDGEFKEGRSRSTMSTAETVLRIIPMALCLAALVVMVKNTQTRDWGSVSYSDLGSFKYLVYANGICAAYSLLSAFYIAVPHAPTLFWAWTVFFLDQIITYIILAAGTASAEVLYLANNGDAAITWNQECEVFGDFCAKATVSVGITFGSVACYMALSLITSYRLFRTYDFPISFRDNAAFDIVAFP